MAVFKELKKSTYISHPQDHRPGEPILEASGLTLRYESGVALDGVSFRLATGERVAVVGPNGAGKSTLFKIIAGVLPPGSGEVRVSGGGPAGHICIAYLPQRSAVDWQFPVTVGDVVMMGRIGKLGLFAWPRRSDWEIVTESLATVGLESLAGRQISELSGGQQQRMFIARALAQEAELMLMDEPLNGLDLQTQERIFAILDELRRRDVTVMIATHDLGQAAGRFDRVLLLNHRLVGFGRPEEVLTPTRLLEAYGGRLRILQQEQEFLALDDSCCGEDGDHAH
jgi:manganese/iron transport system ATP-binding protein